MCIQMLMEMSLVTVFGSSMNLVIHLKVQLMAFYKQTYVMCWMMIPILIGGQMTEMEITGFMGYGMGGSKVPKAQPGRNLLTCILDGFMAIGK